MSVLRAMHTEYPDEKSLQAIWNITNLNAEGKYHLPLEITI